MTTKTAPQKRYRVRSALQTLFRNLIRDDYAPTGVLVNEGGRKSVDVELHREALEALGKLEAAGLLEVTEESVSYIDP